MYISSVGRVRAGCECLSLLATIRGIAGGLAINHIGGDGEYRLSVNSVTVAWVLADFRHHHRNQHAGDVVCAIVVVAEAGKFPLSLKVNHDSALVANRFNFR